jgi:hypothetical protein
VSSETPAAHLARLKVTCQARLIARTEHGFTAYHREEHTAPNSICAPTPG